MDSATLSLDSVLRAGIRRAEEAIHNRAPLRTTLSVLTSLVEEISGPNVVASVLVLDAEGLLRNGASPNLPGDYLAAIDRLKPHADLGTCASVAATGKRVYTPDFTEDSKWAELRHLPLSIGFQGAWSEPILSPETGKVLGTFGTYFRDKRMPSREEIAVVEKLAPVAARAIEALRK
jgi:GAF domain-containing protein